MQRFHEREKNQCQLHVYRAPPVLVTASTTTLRKSEMKERTEAHVSVGNSHETRLWRSRWYCSIANGQLSSNFFKRENFFQNHSSIVGTWNRIIAVIILITLDHFDRFWPIVIISDRFDHF